MQARPSARIILLDDKDRILLFRFAPKSGALAGKVFWATPGGALEPDETYEQAAIRELNEETGISVSDIGPQIERRVVDLQLSDGHWVQADERFFLLRVGAMELSRDNWTEEEVQIMTAHRWWTLDELSASSETIYPENLVEILLQAGGPSQSYVPVTRP